MTSPLLSTDTTKCEVLSYIYLRRAVGAVGSLLPFILPIGDIVLNGWRLQSSLSAYYHTDMRNVFVGSLCALAVFLIAYMGYDDEDDFASTLAGLFALGVALIPTAPVNDPTAQAPLIGYIHIGCAAGLFLTLAYISLALFRRTAPTTTPRKGFFPTLTYICRNLFHLKWLLSSLIYLGKGFLPWNRPTLASPLVGNKQKRHWIYTMCGCIIESAVILCGIVMFLPQSAFLQSFPLIFVLESLAILAFGVAWFIKGETILKDEEEVQRIQPTSQLKSTQH